MRLKLFSWLLMTAIFCYSSAIGQSIPALNGGNSDETSDGDVGLLHAQSIWLDSAPDEGHVSLLADGSGILFVGPRNSAISFSIRASDDYGTSLIKIAIDGENNAASYETLVGGGPEALSATLNVTGDMGNDQLAMAVYINRPAVLARNPMDIDYPAPDQTGRCHEPDFPEFVPENWPVGVVQDALDAIEESIRNRLDEITDPNADPDLEPGHRERLRREREWARKLGNRIAQLSSVTIGASLVAIGAEMMIIGGAGTAVLVADDVTVIGVADDPLIIVTGGVFVVGGVVVLAGELLSWWD